MSSGLTTNNDPTGPTPYRVGVPRDAVPSTSDGIGARRVNSDSSGAVVPDAQVSGGQPVTVDLHDEEVHVNRQPVESGRVRVGKRVRQEYKELQVPVGHDVIEIRRWPVREPQAANRAVQEAELVISAMRDEINLTKQTVLRERVRVDKRRLEEQRTVGTDRRWEELAVDREDLQ
jgi:uncharacterized protein (TIGR02271 family)